MDRRFERISGSFVERLIFSPILVIGLSVSVESFIILHACRTAFWQFLWFYAFYTRESAAACDCQRLFYHLRDYLVKKKKKIFSSGCFWTTRVSGPSVYVLLPYRLVRPCACLLLEPFLLSFLCYKAVFSTPVPVGNFPRYPTGVRVA